MENHIIREDCATIRENARMHLKGNWLKVTFAVGLCTILMVMIPLFFELGLPIGKINLAGMGDKTVPIKVTPFTYNFNVYSKSWLSQMYQFIFTGAFTFGLASFLLNFVRLKKINPGNIFNGFEFLLKTLLLNLMINIFVLLWSLLLIFPGIIASYRYSQAYYILADNPEKGVIECITESKYRMIGNKGSLFVLQFTFIGWSLLATLPMAIAVGIFADNPNGIQQFLIYFLAFIPIYFLMAYEKTAETIFYELLTGHMKPKSVDAEYEVGAFGENISREEENQDFNIVEDDNVKENFKEESKIIDVEPDEIIYHDEDHKKDNED